MTAERKEGEQKFQGSASQVNVTPENLPAALVEIQAASLADAIEKARQGLGSELISWVIADVSGQYGGFTWVCEVTTTIHAKSGPPC